MMIYKYSISKTINENITKIYKCSDKNQICEIEKSLPKRIVYEEKILPYDKRIVSLGDGIKSNNGINSQLHGGVFLYLSFIDHFDENTYVVTNNKLNTINFNEINDKYERIIFNDCDFEKIVKLIDSKKAPKYIWIYVNSINLFVEKYSCVLKILFWNSKVETTKNTIIPIVDKNCDSKDTIINIKRYHYNLNPSEKEFVKFYNDKNKMIIDEQIDKIMNGADEFHVDNTECSICYDNTKYQIMTSCNHNYCIGCYGKQIFEGNMKCYMCRKRVTKISISNKMIISKIYFLRNIIHNLSRKKTLIYTRKIYLKL